MDMGRVIPHLYHARAKETNRWRAPHGRPNLTGALLFSRNSKAPAHHRGLLYTTARRSIKPRSGGRGLNRFAMVVQRLPRKPVRLLGDVGVEVAPPTVARGYLDGGVPVRHEEPSELRPHPMPPTGVGKAHTLDAVFLEDLEGVVIQAAREPQPPRRGEGVEPES